MSIWVDIHKRSNGFKLKAEDRVSVKAETFGDFVEILRDAYETGDESRVWTILIANPKYSRAYNIDELVKDLKDKRH